jgi:hypothetical protein
MCNKTLRLACVAIESRAVIFIQHSRALVFVCFLTILVGDVEFEVRSLWISRVSLLQLPRNTFGVHSLQVEVRFAPVVCCCALTC